MNIKPSQEVWPALRWGSGRGNLVCLPISLLSFLSSDGMRKGRSAILGEWISHIFLL